MNITSAQISISKSCRNESDMKTFSDTTKLSLPQAEYPKGNSKMKMAENDLRLMMELRAGNGLNILLSSKYTY